MVLTVAFLVAAAVTYLVAGRSSARLTSSTRAWIAIGLTPAFILGAAALTIMILLISGGPERFFNALLEPEGYEMPVSTAEQVISDVILGIALALGPAAGLALALPPARSGNRAAGAAVTVAALLLVLALFGVLVG